MKQANPYAIRQRRFARFLRVARLFLMPLGIHLAATIILAIDDNAPWSVLLSVILGAGFTAAKFCKEGRGPVDSALLASWPAIVATARQWYWAVGMHSPGKAAQGLVRVFGWRDAHPAAAVAVIAIASASAGWILVRVDQARREKTGRSFFDDAR